MFQETADEGQGGTDMDNGNGTLSMPTPSMTSSIIQQQQQQPPALPPPPPPIDHSPPASSATSTTTPLTVKDLMSNVIERQLKRNPNSPAGAVGSSIPGSSGTPTISSILKTDHRNDITFVREYKPSSSLSATAMSNRDSNLATLSVVSVPHHGHRSAAASPQHLGTFQYYFQPPSYFEP